MDPNANLEEQRRITHSLLGDSVVTDLDDANRLAELAEALDGWILTGGFLPEEWAKAANRFPSPSADRPYSPFPHRDISTTKAPKSYTEGDWIHLSAHNDWGKTYWSLPGKGLSDHGTANVNRGLHLEAQSLSLRWPDGSITRQYVCTDLESVAVPDMGHVYNVSSARHWVGCNVHGIATKIDIGHLQFDRAEIEELSLIGDVRDLVENCSECGALAGARCVEGCKEENRR